MAYGIESSKMKKFVASGATALMLFVAGPLLADAQTRPVSGNDAGIAADSVGAGDELSLQVTKASGNPFDDQREGELPPGRLAGVEFVLWRAVGVDVTTPQGRADAKRARSKEEFAALERERVASLVTDGDGVVTFRGLTPGLYLLEEIAPDRDHNYHVSSPAWVVLPFGDAEGHSFVSENVMVVKPSPTTTPPPPSTPPTVTVPGTSTVTTTYPRPSFPPVTVPGGSTTSTVTRPPGPPATVTRSVGTPVTSTVVQEKKSGSRSGDLASTGANVWFVVVAGVVLIGLGLYLSRRNAK